ncbi:MAG: glycosyltransferase family 4 protein [Actinomycetota bacterium]|nr:glycosyltransferase family 4 protein [Actinomycetota bacterium]
MHIDQVLVSASPGDAITNAAFELRALLRRLGPSEIYARYYDPRLAGEVVPLDHYARRPEARPDIDIVCFHASIGEPDVMSFLQEQPERLVVIYHNISPADAFRRYEPAFAGLLEAGREELAELASRTHVALADSEFNADELRALGYHDVRVSPLVIDLTRLQSTPPHPGTERHLETAVEGPVVLFVGQLLPHKRPDLLIEAFHVLATYLVPEAHLVLVGAGRLPAYRRALETFVHELNLAQVWVAGPVSDEELVAFYRRADVFVTASEHEGFCVPLVEAMGFDVPVVARNHAAIPETLGGAGVVLPPDDDPLLLAEAMATVVTDASFADELRARGRARLEAFSPERARTTFLSHMLDLV